SRRRAVQPYGRGAARRAPRLRRGETHDGSFLSTTFDAVKAVPLRRNRDFVLLQGGQLFSNVGSQTTQIAYPLLVLALTHSPAKAGIVAFARALPLWILALPAGLAADRYSRKMLMLAADALRAAAA